MIVGSQMDLAEIEKLPEKLIREEADRVFRLHASVSFNHGFLESRIRLMIHDFS